MSLINLLPDDYIRRRQARRSNRLCFVLFMVVMAGVITAGLVSQRYRANTQTVLDRIDSDYRQAGDLMDELSRLQARRQAMLDRAKTTSALLERVPRSYLLAMITNGLPANSSLIEVNLYPRQIITPSAAAPGKDSKFAAKTAQGSSTQARTMMEMEITGLADTDVSVARFIANLARNPLAESVDLVYSQEKGIEIKDSKGVITAKPLMREFQVRMVLRGDIDVIDVVGKGVASSEVGGNAAGGRQ